MELEEKCVLSFGLPQLLRLYIKEGFQYFHPLYIDDQETVRKLRFRNYYVVILLVMSHQGTLYS